VGKREEGREAEDLRIRGKEKTTSKTALLLSTIFFFSVLTRINLWLLEACSKYSLGFEHNYILIFYNDYLDDTGRYGRFRSPAFPWNRGQVSAGPCGDPGRGDAGGSEGVLLPRDVTADRFRKLGAQTRWPGLVHGYFCVLVLRDVPQCAVGTEALADRNYVRS